MIDTNCTTGVEFAACCCTCALAKITVRRLEAVLVSECTLLISTLSVWSEKDGQSSVI